MWNLIIAFTMFVASINSCFGQNDCVFDSNKINDEFLKESSSVEYYIWDNNDKSGRAILKNGGTLHIKKWACYHYGTKAELFVTNLDSLKKHKDYLIDLSSVLGDKEPLNKVMTFLKDKNIDFSNKDEEQMEFNLSDNEYPEFYINIYKNRDFTSFTIYYYKN